MEMASDNDPYKTDDDASWVNALYVHIPKWQKVI